MSFCPNCGTQVAPGVNFCPSCGTSVAQQPQQSQQPVYQQQPQQPVYQQQPQQPVYQQQPQQPVYQQQPQQPVYQQQPQQPVYQQQPQQPVYQQQPQQPVYQQQPQQPVYQQQQQPSVYQQPQATVSAKPSIAKSKNVAKADEPEFVFPTYPEGTPVLTITWAGADESIDRVSAKMDKYINKSTKSMIIEVDGKQIAPDDALSYTDGFTIDVPITSADTVVDIWIRTSVGKFAMKKPNRYNSVFSTRNVFELSLDPSQSYILEITEPSAMVNMPLFGYMLGDKDGNYVEGIGEEVSTSKQIMSVIIPFLGLYYIFASPEAAEDRIAKQMYIIATVSGFCLWILIVVSILCFK